MYSILFVAFLLQLASCANYYGRVVGTANNWEVKDSGSSHHLEVYFDSLPGYPSFQANIDIRSKDGSSLYVAQLTNLSSIMTALQGAPGVKKLTVSTGIQYCNFLQSATFTQLPESQYVSLLEKLLSTSQTVIFFGQVYADSDGTNGIHDIHEIKISGYGDGGFVAIDANQRYYGIFAYFQDQGLKC